MLLYQGGRLREPHPRFYTTDFDEMEQLFSKEINPNLDEDELVAILQEFRRPKCTS